MVNLIDAHGRAIKVMRQVRRGPEIGMVEMARIAQEPIGLQERLSPRVNLIEVMQFGRVCLAKSGDVVVSPIEENDDVRFICRVKLPDRGDEPLETFKKRFVCASRKVDLVPGALG